MKKLLALGNLILFGGMIYLNYLGGSGSLYGNATGEVSGFYPTLFTPAGITFSIWSIIYSFNLAFVIHQLFKAFRFPGNFNIKLNGGFFFVCLVNAGWVLAWHQLAVGASLILMILILGGLIYCYLQSRTSERSNKYYTEYVNFSIYLGWISVASIANVAIYITQMGVGYDGNKAAIFTLATILVAVSLGLFFIYKQGNPWYAIVILWASIGIYLARNVDVSAGADMVKVGAIAAIVILFGGLVYKYVIARVKRA